MFIDQEDFMILKNYKKIKKDGFNQTMVLLENKKEWTKESRLKVEFKKFKVYFELLLKNMLKFADLELFSMNRRK